MVVVVVVEVVVVVVVVIVVVMVVVVIVVAVVGVVVGNAKLSPTGVCVVADRKFKLRGVEDLSLRS